MSSATLGMENRTSRREPRGRRAATTWAAMLLAAAPLPGMREVPIRSIAGQIGATAPIHPAPEGIAFDVNEWIALVLPLQRAEVLEVAYRVQGVVLLSWVSGDGNSTPPPHLPPWHHEVLRPGAGSVTLDFRTTPRWNPERVPVLFFEGTGSVVLTGLRVRDAPQGRDDWIASRDQALRLAPIRIGHTTINFIEPPTWKESGNLLLFEVLGVAFLLLAVGGALAWLALRRRWAPAPFLAVAGVAVALAGNAVFLVRAWPGLALRPQPDAGARLRENFHLDPAAGALAALARTAIRPGERVGVQVGANDWFPWEAICFHLAPNPCVRLLPGALVHEGLSGVDRLATDQLDVVVYFEARVPLLPGFAPVVTLGPGALVARRR